MNQQKIKRIVEREIWYINRSMWMIALLSVFAFSLILPQLGGTIVWDELTALQVGSGIGVLGIIAYFAEKFPPKSIQTKK